MIYCIQWKKSCYQAKREINGDILSNGHLTDIYHVWNVIFLSQKQTALHEITAK